MWQKESIEDLSSWLLTSILLMVGVAVVEGQSSAGGSSTSNHGVMSTTTISTTTAAPSTFPPTETIPRDTTPSPPTTPAPTTALDKYSIFGLPGWATPVIIVSAAMVVIILLFSLVRCVDRRKQAASRERNQSQVDALRATLVDSGAPVRIETRLAQSLRRGGVASRSPKPSSAAGSNQGTPRGGMRGRMDSTGSYETIPSGNTSPRRQQGGGGGEVAAAVEDIGTSSILFSGTYNSQGRLNSTIGSQGGGGRVGRMASLLGQAATVGSGSMNSPRRNAMTGGEIDEEVELMLTPRGTHTTGSPHPATGAAGSLGPPSQSILLSGTSLENQHQQVLSTNANNNYNSSGGRRGSLQQTTKPPPPTTFMKVPSAKDIGSREERQTAGLSPPPQKSEATLLVEEEDAQKKRTTRKISAAEYEKLQAWEKERQRVMHAKDDSILAWLAQTSETPAARGPTSSAADIYSDPLLFDDPAPPVHERSDSGDPFSSIQ